MPRLAALVALLSFLVVGAFGFVHMIQMEHQPMMQGCPFMPPNDDMCLMNALAHFEAWLHTLLSTIPSLFALILVATLIVNYVHVFAATAQDPTKPIPWDDVGIPPPLYQRLFASGLLHPKIPIAVA
jgi:hypothetical protein